MSILAGLYHPEGWLRTGHWSYQNQTPYKSGKWNDVQFRINDKKMAQADFVVVHEDVDTPLIMKAKAGNFILVTGEEKSAKAYAQEFVSQFDVIITSRDDISHPCIIRTHYFHPWSIQKTYDELLATNPVKQKKLSAVISGSTWLPGHRDRFAFINKLKGHYKDELDWFSKGEKTFIEDKWDGLATYNYSIAIENSKHQNYFTEKITDCFLAHTMPVYWGCPNLQEFFDERSYLRIDTTDFVSAIQKIDDAISENMSVRNGSYVLDSKRLMLEKYHFIAAVADVLSIQKQGTTIVKKIIRPQLTFLENKTRIWGKQIAKKVFRW